MFLWTLHKTACDATPSIPCCNLSARPISLCGCAKGHRQELHRGVCRAGMVRLTAKTAHGRRDAQDIGVAGKHGIAAREIVDLFEPVAVRVWMNEQFAS